MLALLASWSEDIGNLTGPLAILAVVSVLFIARKEIKGFLTTMTKVRVQGLGGEVEMTADRNDDPEVAQVGEASSEDPDDEPRKPQAKPEPVADAEEDEDTDQLRYSLMKALEEKDEAKAEGIFKRLQQLEEDPVQRKKDQGLRLWLRFIFNFEPGALDALSQLANDPEVAADILLYRGHCLARASDFAAAASEYEQARAAARDEATRIRAITFYADSLSKSGDDKTAVEALEAALRETQPPRLRADLWSALASVYDDHNQEGLKAIASQKALDTAPDDARLRFNVAYAYSSEDEDDFAPAIIHHYETALRFDPKHETARNNLGVSYQRAGMNILSVAALRQAREDGSGLAAGNLALRYLTAGFVDQADELVKQASDDGLSHAKLAEAGADIIKKRDAEREKRSGLLTLGQRQAAFLSAYAEARVKTGGSLAGIWNFGDNGLEVTVVESDGQLVGEWKVRKTRWKMDGPTHGRSVRLTLHEMQYSYLDQSVERDFSKRSTAYAYLSDDDSTVEIMEFTNGNTAFRKLQRAGLQADTAA